MGTIYIGGGYKRSNTGLKWKIFTFLFLSLAIAGSVLKLTAPMIVERWINKNGAAAKGYAFSIRDVNLSFNKRELVLTDVKIFHPETRTEMLEAPHLSIKLDWEGLIFSQQKKVSVTADQIDVTLSKDFSSEMERIKSAGLKENSEFYLNSLEGKITKLNVLEQKEDKSRTVIELDNVNLKAKEFNLLGVNKKSEFTVSSSITEGGKLSLTGKTKEEEGETPWTIQGSFREVPAVTLNKIAGDKLPFAFREKSLNAEISAYSENGKVTGEISPEVKILDLVEERPGIPTQTIARALTDELTFTLPFTVKDEVKLQYEDEFAKLKNYRKSPASVGSAAPAAAPVKQTAKTTSSGSFWPF